MKIDSSTRKEVHSNSLCIEESSSSMPIYELIRIAVEVNEDPGAEEIEEVIFPIDSTSIDPLVDSGNEGNESNDDMNIEVEISTRGTNDL